MSPKRAKPPIGVGIVGLGFMGKTHLAAYAAAAKAGHAVRVVAVHDQRASVVLGVGRNKGNLGSGAGSAELDLAGVRICRTAEELFAAPDVDLVSICTHTPSHVPLAKQALAVGKHVLVEKPVALRSKDVAELARAAARAERVCMPAMCMRFWPGWSRLKEWVEERTFGAVKSAVFRRLASPPAWARDFYGDPSLNGGALFDLHVHDADLVLWLFGRPASVASTGTLDHVTTLYRFAEGPTHVVAEGGWDHTSGFDFRMSYTVVFERATADFAPGRTPVLTLTRGGKTSGVGIAAELGYDGEVRHVLEVISNRGKGLRATLDDALVLTRILEAERKSLERGTSVRI
jgi:predicted dehydrogenase